MTTGLAPKSHGSHVSRHDRKTRPINPIHVRSYGREGLSGNQPTKNEPLFSKNVITRLFKRRTAAFSQKPEPLIRSELFGIERLEQHAASLAAAQRITASP